MINYEGRRFRRPGDDSGTVAVYHQDGDVVWAEVAGGEVRRGTLTGTRSEDGTLHLGYTLVLATGDLICGSTVNTPEIADDGRVRLRENWQRYAPRAAVGQGYLEEVG
ncbi:hypothetical protein ACQPZF_25295 [Actinosynnema sp. CS-041913]|uniref:hypothetical protein n=1 Tax=Actinosynnema sp. CS-041913 TaxID=3239917 RepID=UPI003D8B6865